MKHDEIERNVIEKVSSGNPKGSDFRIRDVKNSFLKGRLFTVDFEEDGGKWNNRVYYENGAYNLYRNDEILLSALGSLNQRSFFEILMSPESSSGLIAFIIVAIIAALVYKNPEAPKVPDILSQALTLILGFYFGSSKSKSSG